MACTSVQQHQAELYVEPGASTYTFDTSSERYEFITETLAETGTLLESQTTLGTRFKDVSQTRKGPLTIGGDINWEPSKTWFDLWLPRILGTAESTDSFVVAETLTGVAAQFAVLIYRVHQTRQYEDGHVSRFVLRGSQGQLVSATTSCVFLSAASGTKPAVTLEYSDAGDNPYAFSDATISLGGTTYAMTDFELTVDNNIQVRYTNSLNPTSLCPGKTTITLRVKLDLDGSTPHGSLRSVATTGIAGILTLTNGIASTTFTMPKLVKPDSEATIANQGLIDWDMTFEAKKNNTTAAITVTNEDDV